MVALQRQITIEQGATFKKTITWKDGDGTPKDLTGFTARMQVRASHDSTTKLIDISSTGGEITLGGAAGTIVIVIPKDTTAALSAPVLGVWDLELEDSANFVTRLVEGQARITPEVTR